MTPLDPLAGLHRTTPAGLRAALDGPDARRLMYWGWWSDIRNAGDWIGPYLFLSLTGRLPIHTGPGAVAPPHRLHVTCGSILQKLSRPDVAVVWGSGVIDSGDSFARPAEVHAVRGPCTQEALDRQGYPVPDVLGDPGLCLPLVLDPGPREITHRLGLVSHVVDREFWARNADYLPGSVRLIHMDRPLGEIVADIVACEAILSSSLHGVILAHAYGVPASVAAPCSRALHGDGVKFRDYYRSVGMDFAPRDRDRVAFPFWPLHHARRAVLPDADLAAMGRRLLAVCPFAPQPPAPHTRVTNPTPAAK